jgi:hypothetical protein
MATIRAISCERVQVLEADHTVGRLPNSSLVLDQTYVSKRHAILHYSGERWEIRDLGSRNGSYVNGQPVKAGVDVPLMRGFRISFGKLEQEWEFVDDGPPLVMAVPLGGGEPVTLEGEMLALPSPDDPQVTIYTNTQGAWVLEQPDSITEIANQQTFEVGRRIFRFSCPDKISKTALADADTDLRVEHLHLLFSVSRDEEFVQLRVACGAMQFDLGSRQHNYLLLTLARKRQQDAAEGIPETACGWIYLEDLAHDRTMVPPQLNIDVFRIRKQLEAIGVIDPANMIERRPRTKQIRVGVSRFSIVTV